MSSLKFLHSSNSQRQEYYWNSLFLLTYANSYCFSMFTLGKATVLFEEQHVMFLIIQTFRQKPFSVSCFPENIPMSSSLLLKFQAGNYFLQSISFLSSGFQCFCWPSWLSCFLKAHRILFSCDSFCCFLFDFGFNCKLLCN